MFHPFSDEVDLRSFSGFFTCAVCLASQRAHIKPACLQKWRLKPEPNENAKAQVTKGSGSFI